MDALKASAETGKLSEVISKVKKGTVTANDIDKIDVLPVVKVVSNLNEYGIDSSKLQFTDTARNHINEVYKNDKIIKIGDDGFKTKFYAGESTRPYVENGTTLIIDEIMKTKSPIPDPGGIPNGLRWDVQGSFAGKEGVWELVVNKDTNTIVHFLFNSK